MEIKFRLSRATLGVAALVGIAGCSSAPRAVSKPSVAIAITTADSHAPSRAEVAFIYQAVQPEIEGAGYVFAANPRTADYLAHVRYAADQFGSSGGRITIVSVDPNDGRRDAAVVARELKTNSDRAISEMVREPKE
jgi:hypothetical protein